MPPRPAFEIELNPVYIREAVGQVGDLESAIRRAIPWVITRVAIARSADELREAFAGLDEGVGGLRAIVGCELLGRASARPDVRRWLCEYLGGRNLGAGARYQLAGAWSSLGVEARRRGDVREAMDFARRGLAAVADLPPRAITANLYYNLGIALEIAGEIDAAIEAFGDSAEIDGHVGRHDEAAQSREQVRLLKEKK